MEPILQQLAWSSLYQGWYNNWQRTASQLPILLGKDKQVWASARHANEDLY